MGGDWTVDEMIEYIWRLCLGERVGVVWRVSLIGQWYVMMRCLVWGIFVWSSKDIAMAVIIGEMSRST